MEQKSEAPELQALDLAQFSTVESVDELVQHVNELQSQLDNNTEYLQVLRSKLLKLAGMPQDSDVNDAGVLLAIHERLERPVDAESDELRAKLQ